MNGAVVVDVVVVVVVVALCKLLPLSIWTARNGQRNAPSSSLRLLNQTEGELWPAEAPSEGSLRFPFYLTRSGHSLRRLRGD